MDAAALDDDYRELVERARDAVRELLDESEHDAWATLRGAYGQLRDVLARDDRRRQDPGRREQSVRAEEWREAHDAWARVPAAGRESLLLNVLGDERLIIRELTSRLNAELGYPATRPCAVYESHVRSLLMRMLRAGQLERVAEQFNGRHVRYRYSRKRGLDGPIAELEHAYQEAGK